MADPETIKTLEAMDAERDERFCRARNMRGACFSRRATTKADRTATHHDHRQLPAPDRLEAVVSPLCACGCGEVVKRPKSDRPFRKGHRPVVTEVERNRLRAEKAREQRAEAKRRPQAGKPSERSTVLCKREGCTERLTFATLQGGSELCSRECFAEVNNIPVNPFGPSFADRGDREPSDAQLATV